MTRTIQKQQTTTVNISKVDISPYSLTWHEQVVMLRLYESPSAMGAWELYRDVVNFIMRYPTINDFIKEPLEELDLPKNKTELHHLVKKAKDSGKDIPHYARFKRILDALVVAGFVRRRENDTGGAEALFFIDEGVRDKFHKFMEALRYA